MRRHIALVGVVLLGAQALGAQAPEAQTPSKRFDLGAQIGQQRFDQGTALTNTSFVGLDAAYRVPWNPLAGFIRGSTFGVGINIDLSRPVTKGDQFPVVIVDVGDTTFLYTVAQRVSLLQAGVEGKLSVPVGTMRLYGFAGAGIYSIFLDPHAAKNHAKFTNPMSTYGGGLHYPITASIGFRAQLRAVTFTNFDRSRLDATTPYFRDERIKDALPTPHATSSTPKNLQFSLAFQFVPGGK